MKQIRGWRKVATHDGIFHADEVLAFAILKLLRPDLNIIRTRDSQKLAAADLRFDVGGRYCPETGDFDHHQPGGAGIRKNRFPFAACGLIWKHFGGLVIKKLYPDLKSRYVNRAAHMVDNVLIQPVDAYDIGVRCQSDGSAPDPYVLNDMIRSFNPTWDLPNQNFPQAFADAWRVCKRVLKNEIQLAVSIIRAESLVKDSYLASGLGQVLYLDRYLHWNIWQAAVLNLGLIEVQFAVIPNSGGWAVYAQPAVADTFQYRKLLPEAWAGLNGEELEKETGVHGAQYCHNGRWVAGASTREGALQLAKLAIEA
jgi:uncharacterized UPF0160 family protein